jgi:hypothetical protein
MSKKTMSELNNSLIDWFGDLISKWAGAVGAAFIIGAFSWATTVSFQLYNLNAQGAKLEEILIKVDQISSVENRVTFIEKTRFEAHRGAELEKSVSIIELEIVRLKSDISRIQHEIDKLK